MNVKINSQISEIEESLQLNISSNNNDIGFSILKFFNPLFV